jgi:hypothetical protein
VDLIIISVKGAANTNWIVFGLTRSLFEPTIYRTGGEHADHYTIDVVEFKWTKTLIRII